MSHNNGSCLPKALTGELRTLGFDNNSNTRKTSTVRQCRTCKTPSRYKRTLSL